MSLRSEMENCGQVLFSWRSYIPLLAVLLYALGLVNFVRPQEVYDLLWEMFCLFIAVVGLAIRVLTVGYVASGTSGRNTRKQIAKSLNSTGMYSLVRHPLYFGNFLIWLSLSLFYHIWWFSTIMVLVYWVYYERIMLAEERFLRGQFGQDFEAWADRTPAFIPKLSGWRQPSGAFGWKRVLRREYPCLLATISCFFAMDVISDYLADGFLSFDLVWMALFFISLVIYITLRQIKKGTRWLHD